MNALNNIIYDFTCYPFLQIDLMLSGNQPVKAMMYICDLMLFWIVFTLPPKFEPAKSEGCDRYLLILWNHIFQVFFLVMFLAKSTSWMK